MGTMGGDCIVTGHTGALVRQMAPAATTEAALMLLSLNHLPSLSDLLQGMRIKKGYLDTLEICAKGIKCRYVCLLNR